MVSPNTDQRTVDGFGDEWKRFDQTGLSEKELHSLFEKYFAVFPWENISTDSIGFDMGCGSGRWANFVAPRVGKLHCVDPSAAIDIAKTTLGKFKNCIFHHSGVSDKVLPANSMDFGYSLGVLHHVPDTGKAIQDCVDLLKPGAPFLIYLYYALDNRSVPYRFLWRLTNVLRILISRCPHWLRYLICQFIALTVYWPVARFAALMEYIGLPSNKAASLPLGFYRHLSIYTLRTDALDRFGTRLEHRFTKQEIHAMMKDAGLVDIVFNNNAPFWCACGKKD